MIDILIDKLIIDSNGYTAIDITDTITDWLRKNKAKRGFVTINAPGNGCVITLIEYESNLLSDRRNSWQGMERRKRSCWKVCLVRALCYQ